MSQETITSGRSRRARKTIDYSQEQTFSDNDVFEDSDREEAPVSRKKGRPRKSNVGASVLDSGTSFERSKQVYTERGYDATQLPLRERFTFEPEYEDDGTPTIEAIVGRRPIDDAKDRTGAPAAADDNEDMDADSDDEEDEPAPRGTRRSRGRSKVKNNKMKSPSKEEGDEVADGLSEMDYEYLIKFKGRSYLHLEWKTAADLESMNRMAKTIYRRYLKKLEAGTDEDLEDPTVDPSFTEPGRILAEEDHEITVELSDKELVKWEKEQAKELEEMEDSEDERAKEEGDKDAEEKKDDDMEIDETKPGDGEAKTDDEPVEVTAPGTMSIEDLRKIVNKEPYYPSHPGSDNPYRDGYFTEPPRKPRPSYLFYQSVYRSYFGKMHPKASLSQIMTILGDSWKALSDEEQAPFVQLQVEETAQHDKERALLERGQRPTEVWQPIRRCEMVLNRLCEDPHASIFLEPVDTDTFTDYLDIVDVPMDLGTVRERLKNVKNYMGPEVFARDVRKIWNNCKIYNQHGSQIWHVADYMSKLFERLYHAWVLDFRDRYLRWSNPAARPWEPTCRASDGTCKATDNQMVLCDHCDAMYSISCLKPKLKKVPKGAWHCPTCAPKIGKNRTVSILSAVTEQAARKRAEMGDIPKKQVKQKMFLVKWAGLGYEHCTWETQEDINDDAIIAEFRRLEGVTPESPDMTEKELQEVILSSVTNKQENAISNASLASMRLQLQAQTRAFQFKKFGLDTPCLLGAECGPKEKNLTSTQGTCQDRGAEMASVVDEMVWKVTNNDVALTHSYHCSVLPPPLFGEYDAVLPVTPSGLMLNVAEQDGCVTFLGYRQTAEGLPCQAEIKGLVRAKGDLIIAVNGQSTVGKSFDQVVPMLKQSLKFAYIRFANGRCKANECAMTSCGTIGRLLYDDVRKTLKEDRRRLLAKRSMALIKAEEAKDDDSTSSEEAPGDSDDESDSDVSDSAVEPDSEDEALVQQGQSDSDDYDGESSTNSGVKANGDSVGVPSNEESKGNGNLSKEADSGSNKDTTDAPSGVDQVCCEQQTTKHLAYSLLGLDVGYSSDEGGDEDVAYFVDGVDCTFARASEVCTPPKASTKEHAEGEAKSDTHEDPDKLPVKKTDFSITGTRAQLQLAVALTSKEPDVDDFDNYPLPSSKQIAAEKLKAEQEAKAAEEEARKQEEQRQKEALAMKEAAKPKKKSRTKVEQVSTMTSEVVRIWANAEDAASTLQLPLDNIQKILKGYDADLGDEVGGYRWRYADFDAEVTEKVASNESKKGRQAYLEFRDKLYDSKKPHIYKNDNRLRDYQVDGVNWLSSCYYKQSGCILADEMGLGKTVQIVSYIEHLFRVEKIHGPFLVVVPLSTIEHWRREFEGWTDMQCCVYHDRQRVWRDVLREYEWYYEDRPHTSDYLKFNVLVTTYDTLIGDFDVIGDVPWRVTVVDEAHRLRNVKGKLLECMKEISAKGSLKYGYQSRVLMTGTPLQNNTQELWTLLNFIEPRTFPSLDDFESKFGNMANREQVEALQRKISPFMLRRVKEDVAKDIPAKEETVIDVELTSIQKQYYRAIFEHNHAFLSMGSSKAAAPKLMNIQMELRKCCNHPFLLDGVEAREIEKRHEELTEAGEFANKMPDEQHEILNEYGYVLSSGKMVLLDKLLPKLRAEGHKVLIFSQFVKMLDLISDYCEFRNFNYERLDGQVRGNERQKAIDRFETDEDSFMFLLSTRAGGVGINLTAADICIIFDSDWNPQNDVQAQARCHRIGQTKDVMIYRLVTNRTFEQEMFDRASKKLGLEQAVLGTFDRGDEDDKPTSKEMEQLLKRGAYALLEDEQDEIGQAFVADDIENILEKRTRKRVVEGAKTASWLNKKGMNVTKSKFASESASSGIDIDDPLFWQKVMPDFVTAEILLNKLTELEEASEKSAHNKGAGRPTKGRRSKDDDGTGLTRANQRKVNEFMADLRGVLEDLFEQEVDGTLNPDDKAIAQTLLLKVISKESLFNQKHRDTAQKLLQRLEGDRRRKCRTSNVVDVQDDLSAPTRRGHQPDELLITKKKKTKRKKKQNKEEESDSDEEEEEPEKKRSRGSELDDDGFKKHSDDEADWSEVDDNKSISMKEVQRRRAWGHGKDQMKAASMPWPVFPRNKVNGVLMTLIEEVIKIDKEGLGIFSVPVPKDEFPEYYELVKTPMDYGTMKEKLERGEYRSAQAMQKDFILVMQNCIQFNAQESDIVEDAQRQTLMRPKLLKEAAMKNKLFICEDGSVIEIRPEKDEKRNKGKKASKKKEKKETPAKESKKKTKLVACGECDGCMTKACRKCSACKSKKRCLKRKCSNVKKVEVDKLKDSSLKKSASKRSRSKKDSEDEESADGEENRPKPRIRLKLSASKSTGKKQGKKRKSDDNDGNAKKKSRRSNAKSSSDASDSSSVEEEGEKGMFDVQALQSDLDGLDACSFESARENLVKWGAWQLPSAMKPTVFKKLAKLILKNISEVDVYDIFKEPVDEAVVPGYYDTITNPMDFGTMMTKVNEGQYGSGKDSISEFYDDFLLLFDNCAKFNQGEGDVLDEATLVLKALPLTFAKSCREIMGN